MRPGDVIFDRVWYFSEHELNRANINILLLKSDRLDPKMSHNCSLSCKITLMGQNFFP